MLRSDSILGSSSFTPEWSLMPLVSGLPVTQDARYILVLVKVFCKLKRTCMDESWYCDLLKLWFENLTFGMLVY